jgi:hypothetical protein
MNDACVMGHEPKEVARGESNKPVTIRGSGFMGSVVVQFIKVAQCDDVPPDDATHNPVISRVGTRTSGARAIIVTIDIPEIAPRSKHRIQVINGDPHKTVLLSPDCFEIN